MSRAPSEIGEMDQNQTLTATSTTPSQVIPLILILLSAFIGGLAQFFYKVGSLKLGIIPIYRNYQLLAGMILFLAVTVMTMAAFKMGGKLSIVYPAYATTFIWSTVLAVMVDREPYSAWQGVGLIFLVAGVMMVAGLSPK
jgi:drug/metabolite transporter (DMT)-like permease